MVNDKLLKGELDGLAIDKDGLVDAAEVKNGDNAKFERSQLSRSEYVRQGQIRFYGTAAADAQLEGQLLSEVAGARPIWFNLYVGPAGAQRATRRYFRYQFRLRGGGGEE